MVRVLKKWAHLYLNGKFRALKPLCASTDVINKQNEQEITHQRKPSKGINPT